MVKLSIGIPVYNQVTTIAETIESVLSQTTQPFEIVVSENHSTDGTREIVESYKDRVRIVHPPKHCSMAANWNFLIKECQGDWVSLCSGDDLLLPNFVSSITKGIQKDADAVFVMGGYEKLYDWDGTIEPIYLLSTRTVTRPPKTIKMLLDGPKASFAAFSFKKSAYEKVGGYNESYSLIQDWIFQFDVAALGSFIKVDELIARYRYAARPEMDLERKPLNINDRLLYSSEKVWQALNHGLTYGEVEAAAKKFFLGTLWFIRDQNCEVDTTLDARLSQVADKVKATKEFEEWKAGIVPVEKTNHIKTALKAKARKLYNVILKFKRSKSIFQSFF
jgi:glycosyltransferase involved in cell wall biosynthesis